MASTPLLCDGAAMLPFLFLALAGIFWGLGFPFGKIALHEMGAAHMVLLRFAIAAVVSLPFALASREARALFRSAPVVIAGICYGVAFVVQFEGLAHVTVTLAALLVGAMPALIAIAAFLLRERVSRASWIGVAAATLGAVLIAGKPDGSGTPFGIALSLIALLIFLAWLLALRRAPKTASAMAVPAVTVVIAALAVLPIALLLHGAPPLRMSAAAWAGIAGQGLLSTFLATVAWNIGASRVGSAAAGVFINIEPLVGSILGIGFFGDPAGATILVGGAMIIVGSIVTVLGERPADGGLANAAHGLSTD
ncbi:DMT family transporter [Sphingomonas sp. H39-1-10]|uniref:DMT family transporter n=1 Tax=Sphingomonas pollutisoli TaxID=3030829 RepID=UPI0023BA1CD6|nr:DMT family transporter [Sphingomonas pollutisoli]MDF0488033.1 DMT family transporter [Sphingomonas pollutisoli]